MPKLPLIRFADQNTIQLFERRRSAPKVGELIAVNAAFSESPVSEGFQERKREAERFMDAFGFKTGLDLLTRGLTFEQATSKYGRSVTA